MTPEELNELRARSNMGEYIMMLESTTYAEYLMKRTLRGLDDGEPLYNHYQFTTAHEFGHRFNTVHESG